MPRIYRGIDLRGVRDPALRSILREMDTFLRSVNSGNFGDFETRDNSGGLVTKDSQGAPKKWRLRVDSSGETEKGAEIQINSSGAVTGARDANAKGTLIIKIDDAGR